MANACTPSTFSSLSLPGAAIHSITAVPVHNYTASSPLFLNPNHGDISPVHLDFCNVTIAHAHTGHNESILTQIWLPASTWNGRLQAVGGGGFIAGLFSYMFIAMSGAIAEGYAAASTNAGIYATGINGEDAADWFLRDPASPNVHALEDFAFRALGDLGVLAKETVRFFYGVPPAYAYFSGCSNGGRQGYVLAQRYPDAFDGIAACAPGIYWDRGPEMYWAWQMMADEGRYPRGCELEALRAAAMEACDALDGVRDGIMQDPGACTFDPWSMLGRSVDCSDSGSGGGGNVTAKVSEIAIKVAEGEWIDKRPGGDIHRLQRAGYDVDLRSFATTACGNGTCVAAPHPLASSWLRVFVKKDPSWDMLSMTRAEYEDLKQQSVREYEAVIGVESYDFRAFERAGGKMITYQGMSDPAVPYKNTLHFYTTALSLSPSLRSSFRLFLAPGLGHGVGGKGAYPYTTFHALVDWVERGVVPERLEAVGQVDGVGEGIRRVLCAWPGRSVWDGSGEGWVCV
ncbi:tannase and feruloyl esterase [Pyrenochaeta sp. DS3sAY3a]|nr:tannase and feruloyl esterase [Pyrenochaeta sp. DS3sAY3a]